MREKLKSKALCSFQISFTVYTAHFLSGKRAFVGKKNLVDCNNQTFVNHNRAGTVSLF